MYDVSASGLVLTLTASVTFPQGFQITELADDTDPFDIPDIAVATAAMGLNGDLVAFSSPAPITPTLAVIPGSPADVNLGILYDANRAAKGRKTARDVLTLVGNYPDGSTITLTGGIITSGNPGKSVASAGRIKTVAYVFAFEDISRTRASASA